MAKAKTTRHRRADNGQYTTAKYAERHPNTTVRETDKARRAKKK